MEKELKKSGKVRGGRLPYQSKMKADIRANMQPGRTPEGVVEYPSVKNWYREFSKKTRSMATRVGYSRTLAQFCFWMDMDPNVLAETAIKEGHEFGKITWAENQVDDFFNYMEETLKYTRKTCASLYGTMRGFFRANGMLFIKKTPQQWAENRIQPPSKEDLIAVRKVANLREKLGIDIANSLGWRRSDIVNLTYKNVREDFEGGLTRLYVIYRSQKEEVWAANFLGLEATETLRLSIAERVSSGEVMVDESPLLAQQLDTTQPMTPDQFTIMINTVGKRAGKRLTPTHFRKRFRTIAEALIGSAATKRMGGWKQADVGEMYFLPPRDATLQKYKQIEPAFALTEKGMGGADAALEALRAVARTFGIDPLKIKVGREDLGLDEESAILYNLIGKVRTEERNALTLLRGRLQQ